MIDPLLSLAFSVHSNKGVYTLLLGSGVSRAAGIPTGWEIVLDLIRKLAHLKGEECEPDPAAWFTTAFGKKPDYSELLDMLAKSPAERSQLLRGYFEPTDEERERGQKIPTEAHKAIAELAVRGYVRVILTTNFDRLLEEALAEAGIVPTVISTPDSAEGALPLIHTKCTVVKLHGDYLDTRIKNTPEEVGKYDARIDSLLDRVFDEFGLVVCGWSAEWDTALRTALERCMNHRFCTYWTSRGEPSATAKRLMELRRAQIVPTKGADTFFTQVKENVLALESFPRRHPLSEKVAVANLKRYVADDRHKILLHDLVMEEMENVHVNICGPEFPVQGAVPDADTVPARVLRYESIAGVLLSLFVNGCFWGDRQHEGLWIKCIERLGNPEGERAGYTAWLKMRRYPALLLLYGGGIAAMASSRADTVAALLGARVPEDGKDLPAAFELNTPSVMEPGVGKLLPGMERRYAPVSDHVHALLRPKLKDVVPQESRYDTLFDRFEYLLALVCADFLEKTESRIWCPVGRFGWRFRHDYNRGVAKQIDEEIEKHGAHWPFLVTGLFNGSLERLKLIKQRVDEFVGQLPWY